MKKFIAFYEAKLRVMAAMLFSMALGMYIPAISSLWSSLVQAEQQGQPGIADQIQWLLTKHVVCAGLITGVLIAFALKEWKNFTPPIERN